MTQNTLPDQSNLKSARNLTFVAYILFFLGVISGGIFSTLGAILAYVRRKGLENTIYYSHLSRLIKMCWIYVIAFIIGLILTKVKGIGFVVLVVLHIWYIYSLVSGFTKLSDNKAI